MAGKGNDWPAKYSVKAADLRTVPRRFMHWEVEVSVWEGKLRIGDDYYSIAEETEL
jgi:hypothetical protein